MTAQLVITSAIAFCGRFYPFLTVCKIQNPRFINKGINGGGGREKHSPQTYKFSEDPSPNRVGEGGGGEV